MKPKLISAHIAVAEQYAKLSHCQRLKVGAIIVKDDTVIGIGYNGTPAGRDNCCEHETSDWVTGNPIVVTKPEVIHAEMNAIAKVAKSTNSTAGADLFVTVAPCIDCAKMIRQVGIARVYYRHEYRTLDGVDFLRQMGVEVNKV